MKCTKKSGTAPRYPTRMPSRYKLPKRYYWAKRLIILYLVPSWRLQPSWSQQYLHPSCSWCIRRVQYHMPHTVHGCLTLYNAVLSERYTVHSPTPGITANRCYSSCTAMGEEPCRPKALLIWHLILSSWLSVGALLLSTATPLQAFICLIGFCGKQV